MATRTVHKDLRPSQVRALYPSTVPPKPSAWPGRVRRVWNAVIVGCLWAIGIVVALNVIMANTH